MCAKLQKMEKEFYSFIFHRVVIYTQYWGATSVIRVSCLNVSISSFLNPNRPNYKEAFSCI